MSGTRKNRPAPGHLGHEHVPRKPRKARARPEFGLLRLEGEYWSLGFDGRVVRLRDTAGIRYLADLLRRPGEQIPALDLRTSAAGFGPGRTLSDKPITPERARLATTKGLKAALARIEATHPVLGEHLLATIRRGSLCAYIPDPRHPIRWRG